MNSVYNTYMYVYYVVYILTYILGYKIARNRRHDQNSPFACFRKLFSIRIKRERSIPEQRKPPNTENEGTYLKLQTHIFPQCKKTQYYLYTLLTNLLFYITKYIIFRVVKMTSIEYYFVAE